MCREVPILNSISKGQSYIYCMWNEALTHC